MGVNLPGNEPPQLVSRAGVVFQHDGGEFGWTSQCKNSAISVSFDPDNEILIEINDKDWVNKLEACLALRDNIPEVRLARKAVWSKVLAGRGILNAIFAPRAILDDPLKNDKLVKAKLPEEQPQRRTHC